MRDETAKDKGDTAAVISHDLAFSSTRNLKSSISISEKAIFLTTNQHQSLDSFCSKINYRIDLKVSANCGKFTTVEIHVMGEGFSATKKYRSKTTNHSQLTRLFELQVKETPRSIARDGLIFFLLSDMLSSCI